MKSEINMKMNNKILLAALPCVLALSAFPACVQAASDEYTYKWDLDKAISAPGGTTILGDEPGSNIVLLEGSGAKVEADAEVPAKKAIVFDGTQKSAVATQGKLPISENIRIAAMIKPEDSLDAPTWQTVVYLFQQCELRYMVNRGQLLFIVWHGEGGKTVTEVGVSISPNKWNTVEASLMGDTLELKVNGESSKGVIPDGGRKKSVESAITLGYGDKRPFTGRVAEVVVSTPKFN
jgi:hypothetical protein